MYSKGFLAVHEAGHVVMTLHHKNIFFEWDYVTIDEAICNDRNCGGFVSGFWLSSEDIQSMKKDHYYKALRKKIEELIRMFLSGVLATEIEKSGNIPEFNSDLYFYNGGENDFDKAFEVGSCFFREKTLEKVLIESHFKAGNILLKRWGFVENLANRLERQNTLKKQEIKKLWDNQSGQPSP